MERGRRLVLWLVSITLAAPLLWKGHGDIPKGNSVAFLRYSTHTVVVRLKGDLSAPGIYRFSDGVDLQGVTNVTAPLAVRALPPHGARLKNGTIIDVRRTDPQRVDFRVAKMKAGEMMLLGIPLHPDEMDVDDWDCLPGIGPILAQTIVTDRQINGDFGALAGVERVAGVGNGKLKKISRYFWSGNRLK